MGLFGAGVNKSQRLKFWIMKKGKLGKYISITIALASAILFIIKFGGPPILRLYIEAGIGNCQKIPILCMGPSAEQISFDFNKDDAKIIELHPYKFPKIEISAPDGFTVVEEKIKKVYYKKKKKNKDTGSTIYLLYEEPGFFIGLFPQLKKSGINNDYEFIRRTMYANLGNIRNITDTFFVIMKSIFIPDLGKQIDVQMAQFKIAGKKGFINYNLSQPDNYFDCNVFDDKGNFFKIYIKDKGAHLDLDHVLSIISMVSKRG